MTQTEANRRWRKLHPSKARHRRYYYDARTFAKKYANNSEMKTLDSLFAQNN